MAPTLTPCNPAKSAPARLNWIDALRGLTMISVVMVHVLVGGFGLNPDQSALAILRGTFTLPLFFFVSGFFLYHPLQDWTPTRIRATLRVRATALVGGTALFATLFFIVTHRGNPLAWLPDGNFVEYWYTISLFQIFIWYMVAVVIGRILGRKTFRGLLFTAMAASVLLPFTPAAQSYWCYWWLNEKTALYFQFFAIGMLVKSHQSGFFAWLERPWVLTLLIVGYTASLLGGWSYAEYWAEHSPVVLTLIHETLSRYFGLLLVLRIFYSARDRFENPGRFMSRWLLIGRRTLDIYFLHYFFLPRMRWLGIYLVRGNTFVPELISAALVTIVILALILPLSHLLRSAPLLRRLLGVKPERHRASSTRQGLPAAGSAPSATTDAQTPATPHALPFYPLTEAWLSAKKVLQDALAMRIGVGDESHGKKQTDHKE
ncbi:MAG: acyltransferase [Muribaculaceae bacterium]|nr:acyltransferase [Muribaculaceae bacterium]